MQHCYLTYHVDFGLEWDVNSKFYSNYIPIMNARIIQLVEDLQREVSLAEPIGDNLEYLREENESLKKQLADSKQRTFELENKLETLEQENTIIQSQKRKLKLVVIKLKQKLDSKDRIKSKKTIGIASKNDIICINEESNKCSNSEMNDSMSTYGNFINYTRVA